MTAKAAIEIVRLFLQSMNTNEKHLLNVKSYASQFNLSGVNHMLPSYLDNEANLSNSSKRFDKCSNIKSHTCLRNINYEFPLNVYQYYVKHLSLSVSDVPKWLYCHIKSYKTRQCVTNKKDSSYDPKCDFILQDSIGRVVDSKGNILAKPPRWIIKREHPYVPTKNTTTDHYGNSTEMKNAYGSQSSSPKHKKQRSESASFYDGTNNGSVYS